MSETRAEPPTPPRAQPTLAETLAHASHRRNAMVERRTIGLKIVVGVVSFDLVFLKIALDASDTTANATTLAWAVRMASGASLIVLAGMLTQLERNSAHDRLVYKACEERARAMELGEEPPSEAAGPYPWHRIMRDAWATTWPLLGVLALTVAIWIVAGTLTR